MQNNVFKKIKPVTSSQRFTKLLKKPLFFQGRPLKSRTFYISRKSGRNNGGRITIFHRGGGHKKLYRKIDFERKYSQGVVLGMEYDPFRNSFIARVYDSVKGSYYYVLAPKNLHRGCYILSGKNSDIKIGHSLPLSKIPVGMLVHNVSVSCVKRGQYARSAGTFAQLIQKTKKYARVRLPSGEQRLIFLTAFASLGVVSNDNFILNSWGKAGRSRWKGIRPYVRGVAMNPVDHPHGGGEGKTSGGRPSVSSWGKPAKGVKTTRSRNPLILVHRNKK
jgi:large subunit ribosomal protein L2